MRSWKRDSQVVNKLWTCSNLVARSGGRGL